MSCKSHSRAGSVTAQPERPSAPFHALPRLARLSPGAPARAHPRLAPGPGRRGRGRLRQVPPHPTPEARGGGGEPVLPLCAPPSRAPTARGGPTCAPRPGSAPALPGGGEASRARPASSRARPGTQPAPPCRARPPPALTVGARRSARAAGQTEQQQERQQAARRVARASGPPAHAAAAAASLPARPRLLPRPRGAEIRRRAPRGGGRPGRFRRRAGEPRAPRGPGEVVGRRPFLPA